MKGTFTTVLKMHKNHSNCQNLISETYGEQAYLRCSTETPKFQESEKNRDLTDENISYVNQVAKNVDKYRKPPKMMPRPSTGSGSYHSRFIQNGKSSAFTTAKVKFPLKLKVKKRTNEF